MNEPSDEFVNVEFATMIRCNYYPAEIAALHVYENLLQGLYLIPAE